MSDHNLAVLHIFFGASYKHCEQMLVHLTRYCNKVKAVCTRKHNSPPQPPLLVGGRSYHSSFFDHNTDCRQTMSVVYYGSTHSVIILHWTHLTLVKLSVFYPFCCWYNLWVFTYLLAKPQRDIRLGARRNKGRLKKGIHKWSEAIESLVSPDMIFLKKTAEMSDKCHS